MKSTLFRFDFDQSRCELAGINNPSAPNHWRPPRRTPLYALKFDAFPHPPDILAAKPRTDLNGHLAMFPFSMRDKEIRFLGRPRVIEWR
jgi:hypothetical protein